MDLLINIDVENIERAIQFYTRAFDLQVGRRLGVDTVELLGGASPIYLLAKASGTQASPDSTQQRTYVRHWTPVHLDIVVKDIEAAIKQAVTAGAILEQGVQTSEWGKLALLADPFGHGFCLVQFVGRGYDEIALEQVGRLG